MIYKITWKTHMICTLISLAISLMMGRLIDNIMVGLSDTDILFRMIPWPQASFMVLVVLLMVPITLVHEYIHGVFYRSFKGKVRFGFKGIYAYCQETSGIAIERVNYLIVLLSPLVFISILAVLIGGWIGSLVYLLNLMGSSGDLYMAYKVSLCGKGSRVIDRPFGFEVIA